MRGVSSSPLLRHLSGICVRAVSARVLPRRVDSACGGATHISMMVYNKKVCVALCACSGVPFSILPHISPLILMLVVSSGAVACHQYPGRDATTDEFEAR